MAESSTLIVQFVLNLANSLEAGVILLRFRCLTSPSSLPYVHGSLSLRTNGARHFSPSPV